MNKLSHPLPKKLVEWNNLPRIINLDTNISGTLFIQTHKEDDMINRKHKITAFQQDVREDRTNWLKWNSEAVRKKTELEQTFSVRVGLYIPVGVGTWSGDLSFAWILPENPESLPPFIKQDPVFFNAFSSIISERVTNSIIVANLEETVSRIGSHVSKAEPDQSRQRAQNEMMQIGTFLAGMRSPQPSQSEEKKKPQEG